jgi:LacI family transcriptional regulator
MALGYYDPRTHSGIAKFAREAGWILDAGMAHYGILPDYWQGDGIITVLFADRPDVYRFMRKAAVPAVSLTNDMPRVRVPRVMLDNERIGRLGAEHLLERGFKNLAFYKCSDNDDVRGRERGFRERLAESGLRCTVLDWHAASASPRGRTVSWFEWLAAELKALPRPLGILAQSDNRAYRLIEVCEASGISVPEDVAVVGVDNDEFVCDFASVPISSVDGNRFALGYEGAALLDKLMRGGKAPTEPVLVAPLGLTVRKSSDILAIEHPDVAKALGLIWDRYTENIGVEDVLAASAMSRCGLYRAFEKHVGRTIGEEITRKRVEHAKRLLVESKEKLYQVARLSGFGGPEHFSRAFRRFAGMAPIEFRRKHGPRA